LATAKCPDYSALATELDLSSAVISRGYGGQASQYPLEVSLDTPVEQSGDEPALIVRRTKVPMCVGPNRQLSIEHLLERYEIDVIISDDGLQHHALQRDIEVCIIDNTQPQVNPYLLPAGPLRESLARLNSVDFVVYHGSKSANSDQISMGLVPGKPLPVVPDTVDSFDPAEPIHVLAGIGNPQRFFNTCAELGYTFEPHAFPDHDDRKRRGKSEENCRSSALVFAS